MNDIFRKSCILKRIRELILVTDLAQQPDFIKMANKKLEQNESLSSTETMKLMLKCADISNEVRSVKKTKNVSRKISRFIVLKIMRKFSNHKNFRIIKIFQQFFKHSEDQRIH